jgi:VWFA-related protein
MVKGRTAGGITNFIPVLCLLLLILGLTAAGQDTAKAAGQKTPSPLRHEVAVMLKLIQVTVTDKDGKPVPDLRLEEFILFDNGRQQNLTEFERHDLSLPPVRESPAEIGIVAAPAPAPRLLNRKIFFFFDFTYGDWQGARRAARAALHFLNTSLLPTDEVGVISCSGQRSVQVHQFLTREHERVRRVVQSFGLGSAAETALDAEERYELGLKDGAAADARPEATTSRQLPGAKPEPKMRLAELERWTARNFTWNLRSLAQALRYLPGQKTLVLFSGGIPGRLINREPVSRSERGTLDLSVYDNLSDMNRDLRDAYSDALAELASSNVAVYPINTDPPTAASEMRTGAATLREMAKTTGGRYFGYVSSCDEHLEKINALTGTFYVLGYPVSEVWDGKYHEIGVKVTRPGCSVRAQAGYFNPRVFAEFSDLEKLVQLVDLALAENPLSQAPVRFTMRVIPLASAPPDNLGFIADVPLRKLGEVVGPKVEVSSLVFNSGDAIVDSRRFLVDLSAAGPASVFLFSRLSAPPGEYRCRVVLRNMETGRGAVAGASAIVPVGRAGELRLCPPLLLVPLGEQVYLGEDRAAVRAGKGGPAALAKAYLFDVSRYAPYLEKSLRCNTEVMAGLRCEGATGMRLKLSAFLADSVTGDETAVPIEVLAEKTTRQEQAFFVRLRIPQVDAEVCALCIVAEDPTTGASSRLASTFAIE